MRDEDHDAPGAAAPPGTTKAGCGIRYEPDAPSAGIDFSGAEALRPTPDDGDTPDAGN
ncbi:hypothetical protein [Marinobacter bohaiensis]|uniref:hypothetical protein n=1 Tax=Marinobacter bohaiensis TaxID=2201898 RepID=UPI00195507F6|nr:hypothetical protein [Marinobacter bohaiensis]